MEFMLAGMVTGAGYLISKQFKPEIEQDPQQTLAAQNLVTNNADTVYSSSHIDYSTAEEVSKVEARLSDALIDTSKITSVLSGQDIDAADFKHNNMVPFFGANVKQNTAEGATQNLVELFTGTNPNFIEKQSTEPMFEPLPLESRQVDYGGDDTRSRIVTSTKQHNVHPTIPIKVGPGLDKGYTNKGSGGFHQANTRDYIMPRSVDELRVKTNPKLSFQGRVLPGKSRSQKRQVMGQISQYKKPSSFAWGPERYFKTMGDRQKASLPQKFIMKDTNRKDCTQEYVGPQGPATTSKPKQRGKYRKSNRNVFTTSGARNVNLENKSNAHDYGKSGFTLPETERDVTGTRTYLGHTTSIVKALVAPIQDLFKTTKKQGTMYNARNTGNYKSRVPKLTVHDPNDVARTTLKETSIHNSRSGNITTSSHLKGVVYDPNDVARTTLKETNLHTSRTGNISTQEQAREACTTLTMWLAQPSKKLWFTITAPEQWVQHTYKA